MAVTLRNLLSAQATLGKIHREIEEYERPKEMIIQEMKLTAQSIDPIHHVLSLSMGEKSWRYKTRMRVTPVITKAIENGVMRGSISESKWIELQFGWRRYCHYIAEMPCTIVHDSYRLHTISSRLKIVGERYILPKSAQEFIRGALAPIHAYKTVEPFIDNDYVQVVLRKPAKEDPITVARMLHDIIIEHMQRVTVATEDKNGRVERGRSTI